MKLILEEEITEKVDGVDTVTRKENKEVTDKAEAIKDKTTNKCFLHKCYHDEKDSKGGSRRCTLEELK